MCSISQIMSSFVLFSLFALDLCDRYNSQMMQDVFRKLEAKILENEIICFLNDGHTPNCNNVVIEKMENAKS